MTGSAISRLIYQSIGVAAFGAGTLGIFLPLLPTVPLYILAAFCFARSNRAWEAKLLNHPKYGSHLRAWREKGEVSRKGKIAATTAFAISTALGALTLKWPWIIIPPLTAVICLTWLWSRPEG